MSNESLLEAQVHHGERGPVAGPGDDEKGARKRRKVLAKLARDAERQPKSLERYRILKDSVDEGRRVVELVDHKARYALVVIGVLNAGVFFLLARGHFMAELPAAARPWLIGFLIMYAALTFLFVFHAINSLRPRLLRNTGFLGREGVAGQPGPGGPLGLLYWESIAGRSVEEYRRAWSAVTMEQIADEAAVISHHLSLLIAAKYRALGRLYAGLTALVILAALQLVVYAGFMLAR
ncbi:MAG: hypothetical protein FJ206_00965 [Gemmatimonadetes bacterium]|nr:hypothetical protein [Gemmatimonadota bacterium]